MTTWGWFHKPIYTLHQALTLCAKLLRSFFRCKSLAQSIRAWRRALMGLWNPPLVRFLPMYIRSMSDPTTISLTVTTLGCWEMRRVLISRKEVMGKPSFSFSILRRFKATISFVLRSMARYTTPYVPSSTLFNSWNGKYKMVKSSFILAFS